jgi:hypothetical protein
MILEWRSSSMTMFYTAARADEAPWKLDRRNRRAGANPVPSELASNMRRRLRHARGGGRTQATYYRDEQHVQPSSSSSTLCRSGSRRRSKLSWTNLSTGGRPRPHRLSFRHLADRGRAPRVEDSLRRHALPDPLPALRESDDPLARIREEHRVGPSLGGGDCETTDEGLLSISISWNP